LTRRKNRNGGEKEQKLVFGGCRDVSAATGKKVGKHASRREKEVTDGEKKGELGGTIAHVCRGIRHQAPVTYRCMDPKKKEEESFLGVKIIQVVRGCERGGQSEYWQGRKEGAGPV